MPQKNISNSLLYLMFITAGLVVANIYYCQPLLALIANWFHVNEIEVSNVPLFTQIGYAAGLLFMIPLGDKYATKKIIIIDFFLIIASLLAAATATSLTVFTISSFFIGFSSSIPQLLVPMAAHLSDEKTRGRAIGIVMSGLLMGILGSRFISGFLGEFIGWQSVFFLASLVMVPLFVFLIIKLPDIKPDYKGTYLKLMQSIYSIFKSNSTVRLAALRGALAFAGLSAFWTTLTFLMEESFNYGSATTGSFGILGIVGALTANVVGKKNNATNKNKLITFSSIILIISWCVFFVSGTSMIGLIIGVLLIDMGFQSLHITNQSCIFSNNLEAKNRINTIYMVSFFIGGSLGTFIGAIAWSYFKWYGVSIVGLSLSLAILIVHLFYLKRSAIVK
ncbi:MFS transporter [Lutibacter citreus]|uniref:MFS transporter n=1 Tax=Lutibacter citreus TaxID=2138210 RepID=UPI000DBE0B4A|nr:MFS transporter [Lutibacter citreus]